MTQDMWLLQTRTLVILQSWSLQTRTYRQGPFLDACARPYVYNTLA